MPVAHESTEDRVCFWCPGCDEAHCISRSGWTISLDPLTVRPSVLVRGVQWAEGGVFHRYTHAKVPAGGETVCHSFVTAGRIEFLADSTHLLAGRTVDLPEWPTGQD